MMTSPFSILSSLNWAKPSHPAIVRAYRKIKATELLMIGSSRQLSKLTGPLTGLSLLGRTINCFQVRQRHSRSLSAPKLFRKYIYCFNKLYYIISTVPV